MAHNLSSASRDVSNSQYFDKLESAIVKKAHALAQKRAEKMQYILYHRMLLGNATNGRYPRWNGDNNRKSNKSFAQWEIIKVSDGVFKLQNNATDPSTGYHYPAILMSGKGWNIGSRSKFSKHKGISSSGPYKKLVANDGGLFSTQMPHGLQPWIKLNWRQLKDEIAKEVRAIKI